MTVIEDNAKGMYESARMYDDLGNKYRGRPRDLCRMIARDIRNVADNIRELEMFFPKASDPEDDPRMFDKILAVTYDRAYEKDPILTIKVCKRFQGEERLQWLQNIIDGDC